jgi:hypothetical protein
MMQCWRSKEKPRGDEVARGLDRPRRLRAGERLPPTSVIASQVTVIGRPLVYVIPDIAVVARDFRSAI